MTTPSQAAQAAQAAAINGAAPAAGPAAEECADCVTSGERALAVIGVLIGLVIVGIAIDLGTGGKLSGLVGLGQKGTPTDDDTDAGA